MHLSSFVEYVNHLCSLIRVYLNILWRWLIRKQACCNFRQDLLSCIISHHWRVATLDRQA
jgi:hypothetical protein